MLSKCLKVSILLLCILALGIPSNTQAARQAAAIPPYPDAPLCPTHNDTQFHGLWDYDRGCHYDHTHNDDPGLGNTLFGPAGATWAGQSISYPWMTPNENDQNGHQGYKYYVNLNPYPACAYENFEFLGQVNCVSAFRIQYHDAGGNAHMVKRFHSYYMEARIQKGSTVGTIQTGGWADYGCLHESYKDNFLPLPGIDPVQANGQTACGPGGQSIHAPPYRAPGFTWQEIQERTLNENIWTWSADNRYGYNRLGLFFFRTLDTWGSIDASDPYEEHFICPDFRCKFNNSEHHVFTILIMIPSSLDTDRDGIINYTGYTDIKGNIVTGCTAPGLNCVPLRLVNVPVGTAVWARAGGVRPSGEPIRDHDIYFNGQSSGWIQFKSHAHGPMPTSISPQTQTPVVNATSTYTFTPTAVNAKTATPTYTSTPTAVNQPPASPTYTFTPTAINAPGSTPTLPVISSPTMITNNTATAVATFTGQPSNTEPPVPPTTGPNATIFPPNSITSQRGTTAGGLFSLGTLKLSGTDDNPGEYVAFKPQGPRYTGYQSFTMPASVQPSTVSKLSLLVNFKGTSKSKQNWIWSIYDWSTKKWIKLGSATGMDKTPWQQLKFDINMLPQYVSPGGEVRIQLWSNNSRGDARLDYEVLQLTLGTNPSMQSLPVPSATSTPSPAPTNLPPSPTDAHKH